MRIANLVAAKLHEGALSGEWSYNPKYVLLSPNDKEPAPYDEQTLRDAFIEGNVDLIALVEAVRSATRPPAPEDAGTVERVHYRKMSDKLRPEYQEATVDLVARAMIAEFSVRGVSCSDNPEYCCFDDIDFDMRDIARAALAALSRLDGAG